jgi:hypothetical protein
MVVVWLQPVVTSKKSAAYWLGLFAIEYSAVLQHLPRRDYTPPVSGEWSACMGRTRARRPPS